MIYAIRRKISTRGDEKEFTRLTKLATKAKKESDECMEVGSELIAIQSEFADIVKSGENGVHVLKKLDDLKKRSDKADKIRKKDLLKVFDRHYEAEGNAHALGSQIQMMEFRLNR